MAIIFFAGGDPAGLASGSGSLSLISAPSILARSTQMRQPRPSRNGHWRPAAPIRPRARHSLPPIPRRSTASVPAVSGCVPSSSEGRLREKCLSLRAVSAEGRDGQRQPARPPPAGPPSSATLAAGLATAGCLRTRRRRASRRAVTCEARGHLAPLELLFSAQPPTARRQLPRPRCHTVL